MPVKSFFNDRAAEYTSWRHDLHRQPELMYDLPETAAKIARWLRAFGCDIVEEGIARSGVVGVIKGQDPDCGAVIGLRADMDALPITEASGLAFASETDGKMHACGHDGHMAILLGAAQYLAQTRAFKGTVVVVFQPAEEGGGGGLQMCREGLMERFAIQEIYGLHNMPGIPAGHFAICEGPIMAACDEFDITISGKGGHAATPHLTTDPVVVAAQMIMALQTITSRNVNPHDQVVVSVCAVETDSTAHNVISEQVVLRGTVRSMSPQVRDFVEQQLGRVATSTAQAFGATADISYHRGYPVTFNHADGTAHAINAALAVSADVDPDVTPMMGAEDFSYMLEARPGAYIWLGNGDSAALHSPHYQFDDSILPSGAAWFSALVEQRMPID